MKKNKFLLVKILMFFSTMNIAQGYGEWTWMKGNNYMGDYGIPGLKGIPDPLNNPPGLYEAAEWTDLNGNFWFFGGVDPYGPPYESSALWKFDPITNNWVWMHGSLTFQSAGIYGTKGVPAPNNTPGARGWGATSWVDNSGDLWLFGGLGLDKFGNIALLNDLWRYHIPTNQWTWMKGSSIASTSTITISGTKGVANIANTPDGRQESNSGIADGLGNLWLFGGLDETNKACNDIWKYNIATNMWTWVSGNQTHSNIPNYGVQNISSPTNNPGDRVTYTKFIDSNNNMYFFGAGLGKIPTDQYVADVWKFSPLTLEWTWVGGSNLINTVGSYLAQCDSNSTNSPLAKFEIRASWPDSCGFFFWGGIFNITDTITHTAIISDSYNDLWYYNIENNQFTWLSGSNIANDFGDSGTQGISAPTNMPSANFGSLAFRDKQNNLWLYSGFQNYDDLWRFKLNPNCSKLCSKSTFNNQLSANFSANTICGSVPLIVQFTNISIGANAYDWDFGDGSVIGTMVNPSHTYTANGVYNVSLIAHNSGTDTSTIIKNSYIYIGNTPNASFSTLTNDTLCLNTPFSFTNTSQDSIISNNWSFGDGQVASTSNTFHNYVLAGSYTVSLVVTDNHNCVDTVKQKVVILPIPSAQFTNTPTNGCAPLKVQFFNASSNATIYNWNFGDSQTSNSTSLTHTYNSSGTYVASLVALNLFGCNDTAKTFIIVRPKPDANFTLTGYEGCFPYAVDVFANTIGLTNYQWIVNGNSNFSINDSISIGNLESNTTKQITLITTNSFGCKDTISLSKTFTDDNCSSLNIPNVFTPNGDASNSLFTIKATNYKLYNIQIFDRWGMKTFESTDFNMHWNGKKNNNGSDCSDGTYFYIIHLTDKNDKATDYKGFLNLFR